MMYKRLHYQCFQNILQTILISTCLTHCKNTVLFLLIWEFWMGLPLLACPNLVFLYSYFFLAVNTFICSLYSNGILAHSLSLSKIVFPYCKLFAIPQDHLFGSLQNHVVTKLWTTGTHNICCSSYSHTHICRSNAAALRFNLILEL